MLDVITSTGGVFVGLVGGFFTSLCIFLGKMQDVLSVPCTRWNKSLSRFCIIYFRAYF